MIVYLATRPHCYAMTDFLDGPGAVIAGRLSVIAYDEALRMDPGDLPSGTWIFSDIERLGTAGAVAAARLWQVLADRGCRLLNHPTRALRRYEMLRLLHDRGINDFDVQRLTDRRFPARFPVFLRRDDNHSGALSGLCPGPQALAEMIADRRARGWPRQRMILVEFSDTADGDGLYRKYGAFRVGGRIVAGHMDVSRGWAVKDMDILDPVEMAAEIAFVEDNPWKREIETVFALARLDYGRIDFSVRDGRPVVWEINTNPLLASPASRLPERRAVSDRVFPQLVAAFADLDASA